MQRYDNPEGWLRLVVTRLATDRWRWLGVRRASPLPPPDPVPPPDVELMALVAALKQLPFDQRRALALHYLLDRSVADIAAETGTNVNTVKSWLALMASDTGVAITSRLGGTAAYDFSGNPLLPAELAKGLPMWVDSGNLLIVEAGGITGFSLTTKRATLLGKPSIAGYCSWSATMLTCPTEKGITVWRYAN